MKSAVAITSKREEFISSTEASAKRARVCFRNNSAVRRIGGLRSVAAGCEANGADGAAPSSSAFGQKEFEAPAESEKWGQKNERILSITRNSISSVIFLTPYF